MNAITQTVVSSLSLNLGFFPFPQGDLGPKQTPLTYTNLGSAPVTLETVGRRSGSDRRCPCAA